MVATCTVQGVTRRVPLVPVTEVATVVATVVVVGTEGATPFIPLRATCLVATPRTSQATLMVTLSAVLSARLLPSVAGRGQRGGTRTVTRAAARLTVVATVADVNVTYRAVRPSVDRPAPLVTRVPLTHVTRVREIAA